MEVRRDGNPTFGTHKVEKETPIYVKGWGEFPTKKRDENGTFRRGNLPLEKVTIKNKTLNLSRNRRISVRTARSAEDEY
jgi:hypothetical protein